MPRISRPVAVEYPHHITQRGNYQQAVFEEEDDYIQYLQWLNEYCGKYFLKIWAYCLMGNHVHFIVVPMKDNSLAKTFNTLHMRYSQYFNKKKNLRGHLWQGQFYSCILDNDSILSDDCYLVKEKANWLLYLMERDDEILINSIRQNTKTGRPCGNEVFVKKIEDMLGKKLAALPRGRPAEKKK